MNEAVYVLLVRTNIHATVWNNRYWTDREKAIKAATEQWGPQIRLNTWATHNGTVSLQDLVYED